MIFYLLTTWYSLHILCTVHLWSVSHYHRYTVFPCIQFSHLDLVENNHHNHYNFHFPVITIDDYTDQMHILYHQIFVFSTMGRLHRFHQISNIITLYNDLERIDIYLEVLIWYILDIQYIDRLHVVFMLVYIHIPYNLFQWNQSSSKMDIFHKYHRWLTFH